MTETIMMAFPKTERNCSNCACFFTQQDAMNPTVTQGFCRRNTVLMTQVRVSIPVLDTRKQPMVDKTGMPRVTTEMRDAFIFTPTVPNATCFDGWRPIGVQPGARWIDSNVDEDVRQAELDRIAEREPDLTPFPGKA